MHTGQRYKTIELLVWTRRNLIKIFVLSIVPVFLYHVLGWQWMAIPWTVVALLGTATAFIVGFKNTQTYNRTWEARQIWGAILNSSRAWGTLSRDFVDQPEVSKELIYRHFAWLTALRYSMREGRNWEAQTQIHNREFQEKNYKIPEKETSLEEELQKYLPEAELKYILSTKNKAAQLLSLQSKTIKQAHKNNKIGEQEYVEMQRTIKDFFDHQGKSERIKNFPYPRQFATINTVFIRLFCILLPFGMLKDFDKLNDNVSGILQGNMIWLVVPFSMLLCWMYTSLDQVGESTENPFEGSPNDVPISQISRTIEIDLREMLGETDLPPAIVAQNNFVL